MNRLITAALGAAWLMLLTTPAPAAALLQATDFIVPIDFEPRPVAGYPGDGNYGVGPAGPEGPSDGFDNSALTKYLNFGEDNSGAILILGDPTTIKSMLLTTANDAPERDPASYKLWGTNDMVTATNNGNGEGTEVWTLISEGGVTLPAARGTPGPFVAFDGNSTAYNSYRILFPSVRNTNNVANSMQIAEIGLYESPDATGNTITFGIDPTALDTRAYDVTGFGVRSTSRSPATEGVGMVVDQVDATKYLNFGQENTGFIVTPNVGSSIITSFQITTANDFSERDPLSFVLFGTNETIASVAHSVGDAENWVEIAAGDLALPEDRQTAAPPVTVENSTAYQSYRLVFPTLKNVPDANSMQIADIQFFGEFASDADFDNDGDIDGGDFLTLQRNMGGAGPAGDADGSGTVDGTDLAIFESQFGPGGGVSAAPEPASAALAALALLAAAAVVRKRG